MNLLKFQSISCILIQCLVYVLSKQVVNLYEILGIDSDATPQQIRKAFKKKAIIHHPDKKEANLNEDSKDENKASEHFQEINRAYEILKNPKQREIYDRFGEEGLKEHEKMGSGHWNYHGDMGLYDNDEEIISIDENEFELNSFEKDIWIVKYYSSQCSKCKDFATDYRRLGQEMYPVVNVAAMDCSENQQFCQIKEIQHLPTIILYPDDIKYSGELSYDAVYEFVLKHSAKNKKIWKDYQFINHIEKTANKRCLVSFCKDDCISTKHLKLLSSKLHNILTVGTVDCYQIPEKCDVAADSTNDIVYYENCFQSYAHNFGNIASIHSIYMSIIIHLPDIKMFDNQDVEQIFDSNLNEFDHVIYLYDDEYKIDDNFKVFAENIKDLKMGRVECKSIGDLCSKLAEHSLPAWIYIRKDGAFERHYGKSNVHDLSQFIEVVSESSVLAVSDDYFNNNVINSKDQNIIWVVDFFSPACAPCMRFLKTLRKYSSTKRDNLKFVSLNCMKYRNTCSNNGIRSYPTCVIMTANKAPIYETGSKSESELDDFIEFALNPVILTLNEDNISRLLNKPKDEMWLVDYYIQGCPPCQMMMSEWNKLGKYYKSKEKIIVAKIDCSENMYICNKMSIYSYPHIVGYPTGSKGTDKSSQYNENWRNADAFIAWSSQFRESFVKSVDQKYFNKKILNSKTPHIVDFYASWCRPCNMYAPKFNDLAEEYRNNKIKFVKIDCNIHGTFCNSVGIDSYPTIRYYSEKTNNNFGVNFNNRDVPFLRNYIETNIKPKAIPKHYRDEL